MTDRVVIPTISALRTNFFRRRDALFTRKSTERDIGAKSKPCKDYLRAFLTSLRQLVWRPKVQESISKLYIQVIAQFLMYLIFFVE